MREEAAMKMEIEITTKIAKLNERVVENYLEAQKLLFEKTIFIDFRRYLKPEKSQESNSDSYQSYKSSTNTPIIHHSFFKKSSKKSFPKIRKY